MPEVGLISLARHAVSIARMVLPRYRSKFSKHQFTQPQLFRDRWHGAHCRCGEPLFHSAHARTRRR